MIGLTGSYEQIEKAVKAFRTTFGYHIEEGGRERPLSAEEYRGVSADSAYVPYHSSQIYLLGSNGELLDIIGYGSKPDDIAARIEQNFSSQR
jgi:cytochrome oxidase Cu insertion factor (SCO1/SenC/PrrC family)